MLFVNNRCEPISGRNEDHIELLRTSLFVYEIDKIQCILKFENKSIPLDRSENASCSLSHNEGKITLYVQKVNNADDGLDEDYFSIGKQLIQFAIRNPSDTLVDIVTKKLSESLKTLKEQGVPVDQLMAKREFRPKTNSVSFESEENDKFLKTSVNMNQKSATNNSSQINIDAPSSTHNSTDNAINQRKNESYENLPEATQQGQKPTSNRPELQTNVYCTGPTLNFGSADRFDNTDLNNVSQYCREYTHPTLTDQKKDELSYIDYTCEEVPAADMTRHKQLFHSIPLFVERDVNITANMLNQAKQFAWLLTNLASYVFQLPIKSLHLYRDISGSRVAYNHNGSVFFNLRYFEQVFAGKLNAFLQKSILSDNIVTNLVNYYYIIICHELAHNHEPAHNEKFIELFEKIAVKYMDRRVSFLEQFSFESALED